MQICTRSMSSGEALNCENRKQGTMKRISRMVVATVAVFAAFLVDMEGSLALTPSSVGPRKDVQRRASSSSPPHHEDFRKSTELNVATLSPDTLLESSIAKLKLSNPVQPIKRSLKPSDIMRRPSRRSTSTPVSLDKSCTKQRVVRPYNNPRINGIKASSKKQDSGLLSKDEEKVLTQSIRNVRRAIRIRDEHVQDNDSIPSEAEWAGACDISVIQLRRVMYEGQQARTMLVSANGGLVTSIAKRHYLSLKRATEAGGGVGTILTLQDMVQEGNLGLMQAAERFEPERDLRFSTYATYWIRQRILRSISDSSRVIRLPAHGKTALHRCLFFERSFEKIISNFLIFQSMSKLTVHSMLQKINKARKGMSKLIGREPSTEELAHYLEMRVEDLKKMTSRSRNVVSLEKLVGNGGSLKEDRRTIGDTIASDAPTPEEDAQRQYLKSDIRAVVNELAQRERDVLILRYGLEDGKSMTVNQTAKHLGISSDRVRSVEARAINKLRSPQRNYRLKEYVGGDSEEEPAEEEWSTVPERPEKLWFF